MPLIPLSDIRSALNLLPKDTARSLLLNHVSEARTHLRSLERIQNDYCATAVLPPEVLGLILTQAVNHRDSWNHFKPISWTERIVLSSVCRTWRAVALQTPSFWSSIPISASPHFGEMIARSKEALFSVLSPSDAPVVAQEHSKFLEAVMSKPNRLAEFNVEGAKHQVKFYLRHFPTEATPFLSSLRICYNSRRNGRVGLIARHVLATPKPSLQYLELQHCAVPWDVLANGMMGEQGCFCNLVSLCLSNVAPRPPIQLFIDLLRSLRRIRNVDLTYAIPDGMDTIDLRAIKFSRLRYLSWLSVHDYPIHAAYAARLFSRVKHPSTARVEMLADVEHTRGNEEYVRSLTQHQEQEMIETFLETLGLFVTSSTSLKWSDVLDIEIKNFETLDKGVTLTLQNETTTITLSFLICNLPFVLRSLRVSGADGLTIKLSHHGIAYMESLVSSSDWAALFSNHPGIDTVSLVEDLAPTVLQALALLQPISLPPSVDTKHGSLPEATSLQQDRIATQQKGSLQAEQYPVSQTLILPSLTLLHLNFIEFDPESFDRITLENPYPFEAILSLVTHRQRYGAECKVDVDFTNGFTDDMLQLLKDVVGQDAVTWDGQREWP